MADAASTDYVWVPPTYDVSSTPRNCHTIASACEGDDANFVRRAKWCPDGSTALAQCEDASLRYIDFPHDTLSPSPDVSGLSQRAHKFQQAAPVLDFAWYPRATCLDPASFCFVTSVRECPVKLLDGCDGRLRASYRIVDHRERQIAPHCIAFNASATKLYCSFEDAIEVFDFSCPGQGTRLHTTPSKKSRDGLKGILSSLAFSSDASSGVFAAGSLSPSSPNSSNIALFTESTGEVPVMFVGDEGSGHGRGVRASVSQLMFNPSRPHLLYASFRRESSLYCWDIRGDPGSPVQKYDSSTVISEPPGAVPSRSRAATNQRMHFDIDLAGKWLGVGTQEGDIAMFDLHVPDDDPGLLSQTTGSSHTTPVHKPTLHFKAHDDAVGSVSFHPLRPLALSVSGSRHFDSQAGDLDSEPESDVGDDDDGDQDADAHAQVTLRVRNGKLEADHPAPRDASVKLWEFDHSVARSA